MNQNIAHKKEAFSGLPDIGVSAEVLFHPELSSTEKLLFGLLRNLSQTSKGCWASNNYLGALLSVGGQSISNSIANLKQLHFIIVELQQVNTNEIIRHIFIDPTYLQHYRELAQSKNDQLTPLEENVYTPIRKVIGGYKKSYSKDDNEDDNKRKTLSGSTTSLSFDRIKALWNLAMKETEVPQISKLTNVRKNKLKSRIQELLTYDDWKKLFIKIAGTPWLHGKNDKQWIVSFDWIIENDNNYTKVLEGKYDNSKEEPEEEYIGKSPKFLSTHHMTDAGGWEKDEN